MSVKPVIILGAGGHAKVLIDVLKLCKVQILGYTDPQKFEPILGIPRIGDDEEILNYDPSCIELVNGIGSIGNNRLRKALFSKFKENGYVFRSVIHPKAIVAADAQLSEGVQIMAGAVVQPGCVIGHNTIINTMVSIDHDCRIGNHVHIAPGATLSGHVMIEDDVHIGTGANVIQGIKIGNNSLIGAGSLVIHNIQPNQKVMGVPGKEVNK
jgi:sugar O-acyltransferase (sialic acid O-acetyltransferase NeuD family)